MPENPLLPHSKLRELHSLMLRLRDLARKHASGRSAREAFLAATSIHLLQGDLLSSAATDWAVDELAPRCKKTGTTGSLDAVPALRSRLSLCAAAARGVQAAGTEGLVLALTQAGTSEPGWQAALEWAQQAQLPLLLACSDGTGGSRSRARKSREAVLDFATIRRFAKRIKLPVLTVDGEDAVAVYRVMQEAVLRARQGGGPAVLWAVMTPLEASRNKLPRSRQPIARLESYLSARDIPFGR